MFSYQEITQIVQGDILHLAYPDDAIQHLLIDSRKIAFAETSLFFAIKGNRHDGHLFIPDLINKGVRNFIVTAPTALHFDTTDLNIIVVPDAVEALQTIVAAHRNKFNYPVIGITGSNGKTIVKEWLYQLLSPDFHIIRSPKSYNSQVGVPLSVWEMGAHHNLAIFEAGISQVGEMQRLERVIQPTVGVFTNIGSAHDEGFVNREQKIKEKLWLFQHCEEVYTSPLASFSFLNKIRTNFEILQVETKEEQTIFELAYQNQPFQLKISSIDQATLENMLACLSILLYFQVPLTAIQTRFDALRPVAMRLEMKEALYQSYLIDDSYNNDLSGLRIALNFLKLQKQAGKKVAILSDMHETNLPDAELYATIAGMLNMIGIDTLVGIGEKMYQFKHLFEPYGNNTSCHFFENTDSFLADKLCDSFRDALILVKGARRFAFEKIVEKLQKKAHRTVLEINLDALTHNLNFYRSLLQPNTKIMAMVKALAYGSGSIEVAQWLQFHRVDYLGVAYVDEGVFLRKNGITLPIMVLNPTADAFGLCLEYGLEPEIYNFKILEELLSFFASKNEQFDNFKIHIKLDTGMRRLGFEIQDIKKLGEILVDKLPKEVRVASVLSHMAGADEAKHHEFSIQQIALFKEGTAMLEEALGYAFSRHIANSPTITRFPEAHFDMVRLGIGLYGIETSQQYPHSLMPVATFKTIISQIKHIAAGETIGYGRQGVAQQDTTIATIAVGYADGFLRRLSKGVGKVGIQGKLASVIGNVCMDMTMVDITGIQAKEGDEVIIFGDSPTIFDMADALQTIPYEVLTLVSERVKRVFYTE